MGNYSYSLNDRMRKVSLNIGKYSPIKPVKIDLLDGFLNDVKKRRIAFIAAKGGRMKRLFFSSRSALVQSPIYINGRKYNYFEVKGCGKPHLGISKKDYFLEDGRNEDDTHDPIGGFSLDRAMLEWDFMKELYKKGVKTHVPLAIARLREVFGPSNEELGIIVKTGQSNVRLDYFDNNPLNLMHKLDKNFNKLTANALYEFGNSLRILHKDCNLCHNALHEGNLTINGEIVDLEYVTPANPKLIYKDLWYVLLSFAETFGTPLSLEQFMSGYLGKSKSVFLIEKEIEKQEKEAKKIAETLM